MVDRWTVERAIRSKECTLDPPGRQLVLTLLTWTDHATATIPERFTPSLTDLVNGTGLARSTVAAWLNKLEKEGWVVRTRPSVADARSKKARTVYRLTVPSGPLTGLVGDETRPPPGPDEREETRRAGPRVGPAASDSPRLAGPGDGPEMAGSSPGRGLELVRLADGSSPPRGLNPNGKQDLPVGGGTLADHRYVEGPNGYCAFPGCRRSAPLHGRHLAVVREHGRRVIGK